MNGEERLIGISLLLNRADPLEELACGRCYRALQVRTQERAGIKVQSPGFVKSRSLRRTLTHIYRTIKK